MVRKKLFLFTAVGALAVGLLIGCSSGESNSNGVREIKVAFDQGLNPIAYIDDKGNPTGYEIEAMKLVDQELKDYKFKYVGTTSDDLLIGVEQGKFQVGVKNAFFTEERTKKFLYPKEFLGLSSTGLVVKKENKEVNTLEEFAKKGLSLAPIAANSAQYTLIENYNTKHPDNKVKLKAGDTFSLDIVQWVNEERVDGGVMIEGPFNEQVTNPKGAYHNLKNDIFYNEFTVIQTWPLFNKKEQAFAEAYDKAIKKVKEEGKLRELSKKFYSRDLFEVQDQSQKKS
ncbi:L-cystine transport system substrate-binding protein [Oikeobacillus pervagus]|uniref:L-cystine transport system substrate-binding protein n=1 Tax=Oikeobacillus pervagus TaxID=1325931 RepID=A0AAJ1WKH0_9BACI|nr:transporter substrate-binding domain-containing protein [Oikeobacillus pervagus]MDQ0215116.1 L-cystine transport system substrate-binding protein [Oikeobacillus pervagus]